MSAATWAPLPRIYEPSEEPATPAQERAAAMLALFPPVEGLPPVTLADVQDRDYCVELLDCFRSERAAALVASGWVETSESSVAGNCARALSCALEAL